MSSFSDWFGSLWTGLFSSSESNTNRMNKNRSSSTAVNLTFPTTVNYDLAMGLYYNTVAGYKLGAHLCYAPISIPLAFMGFPHFDLDDWDAVNNREFWEDKFKFYNEKYIIKKQEIQKLCHIAGTIGIFPWFDSAAGYVKWNFIKPEYVSKVLIDITTKELSGIITSINYQFNYEDGKNYYFEETTKYTKDKIITTRIGEVPPGIRTGEIRRNPTKMLPVFFTNNKEPGEFEGHSDLERILPIIKAYSEINLRAHEEAMNMKTKLIQGVEDYKKWMTNNGFTDVDDISIENIDFVFNKAGVETTEVQVPKNLIDNHIKLMNLDFWGIVQGSGLPEICWGLKMEGNHASAAEQMGIFLSFIGSRQIQVNNSYQELMEATLLLEAIAYNQTPPEGFVNIWNDLDSLTEVERSEIWKNYSDGIQKLSDSQAIDLEGVHTLLKELTGGKITSDFDDFRKQIEEYGTMKAFLDQDFGGMRDFTEAGAGAEDKDIIPAKSEKQQSNGVK